MNKYCMIEVAFGNMTEVGKVIDMLLSKKPVASTHVIESNSSWNWKNKRENSKEYLLQISNTYDKCCKLVEMIR